MRELYHPDKVFDISWKGAWTLPGFRWMLILGVSLLTGVLFSYPYFFEFVQNRPGVLLHDIVLAWLPSIDVSSYIFFIICITVTIGVFRSFQSPFIFLVFLWGYLLLNLSRLVTITLVPLEPPIGLMALADPIAFPFYGQQGITKDLFYSGHTGTLFLVFLVVKKRWDKAIMLVCTVLIGFLLLVQHIHYTLDVLAAPVFVYAIYLLTKKFIFQLCIPQPTIKTVTAFEAEKLPENKAIC